MYSIFVRSKIILPLSFCLALARLIEKLWMSEPTQMSCLLVFLSYQEKASFSKCKTQSFQIRNIQQHSSVQSFNHSLKDKDPYHLCKRELLFNLPIHHLLLFPIETEVMAKPGATTTTMASTVSMELRRWMANTVQAKSRCTGYPRWFWRSLVGFQMTYLAPGASALKVTHL